MTLFELPPIAADHLVAVALHALRLLPVSLLCPFFGGPLVPAVVRLAIAAGLGTTAYLAGGGAPVSLVGVDLVRAAARELSLGCAIGVVASWPLEAARAAGRLADTLRGATLSELHVSLTRQRETALGDLLVQWTVVLATWAGADRLVLRAVLGSFETIPIGRALAEAPLLLTALRTASELVSCAAALSAPSIAAVLTVDVTLALATRTAPTLGIAGALQPARAVLGLFAVAAAAATVAGRLVSTVALSAGLLRTMTGGAP
jgi:type III secretion protein T